MKDLLAKLMGISKPQTRDERLFELVGQRNLALSIFEKAKDDLLTANFEISVEVKGIAEEIANLQEMADILEDVSEKNTETVTKINAIIG